MESGTVLSNASILHSKVSPFCRVLLLLLRCLAPCGLEERNSKQKPSSGGRWDETHTQTPTNKQTRTHLPTLKTWAAPIRVTWSRRLLSCRLASPRLAIDTIVEVLYLHFLDHTIVDMSSKGKKRKASSVAGSSADKTESAVSGNGKKTGAAEIEGVQYEALSLTDIQERVGGLCQRVPTVPEGGLDDTDRDTARKWATQMQTVLEEFNLLMYCVSSATYKWGSERSGAADQNLSVLASELTNTQDQLSQAVAPKLANVLSPVIDLVTERVVTTKNDKGEEVKQNIFARKLVDEDFFQLCVTKLCRNAILLRQVVLSNFDKIQRCISDYLKAHQKDTQNDSRGFAY